MNSTIRPVEPADLEGLKSVLTSTALFPPEYLDELISDYFNNPDTRDLWFTRIDDGTPTAIGYCIPEKLTHGTYNLLAIGVTQSSQRSGIATAMMSYIEQKLKQRDGRILIVETSSHEDQAGARQFYNKIGYTQMAVIKDFWNEGEDKIVYWKKL